MTAEDYGKILERAAVTLKSVAHDVRFVGEGPSRFLTADVGDRGLEFYPSGTGFIVDPAVGEELQGERSFPTIEEALVFAVDWLTHKV